MKRFWYASLIVGFCISLPSAASPRASADAQDERAAAMAVDNAGNVYVTGVITDASGQDYFTAKYDGSGAILWKTRFDGEGHGADEASGIFVDAAGNVYVTGGGSRIGGAPDCVTVKYNAEGVQQWAARYNGTGNDHDHGNAVTVDAAGNVYVTGFSIAPVVSKDYITIKYNADGVQQWAARYNGPAGDVDKAAAVAVDAAGNVYTSGFSIGVDTARDYATIKYSPDGIEQWVMRYNGPGNGIDEATAMKLDPAGNIYVTGYSVGTDSGTDYTTIKYAPDGTEVWVARYNASGRSSDSAAALAVDAAGQVYVTGTSQSADGYFDYATVKYHTDGTPAWVARYNGPGNDLDEAKSLAVDVAGHVYVTGASAGDGTDMDYATIKYTAEGVEAWVSRYNGPGNAADQAVSIAVDPVGHIYVTGQSAGANQTMALATMKYNPDGVQEWITRTDSGGQ